LPDVPDGREATGGQGVFEVVARGLAEDGGGVGDEDRARQKGFSAAVFESEERLLSS